MMTDDWDEIKDMKMEVMEKQIAKLEAERDALMRCLEGHDTGTLLAKAAQLKGTDGEGWAIGELVEKLLEATRKEISDGA